MIAKILPHGSRRRRYTKDLLSRLRRRRVFAYHKREYNDYRQEYYRTYAKLQVEESEGWPLISIVVPCFNTPYRYLSALVDSVLAQGYGKWELVLVDVSNDQDSTDMIKRIASTDTRIVYLRSKNIGIGPNTNVGIKAAGGDYIALLDHDDALDPDALAENAKAIVSTGADFIYSDEDKVSDDGNVYFEPHFKPDFSLELLRCVNYITHLAVIRKKLLEEVGLIEAGFDGAQDYNLFLNLVDKTDKIHHIPKILYHWRQAVNSTATSFDNKKHVTDAGEKALGNHYVRRGIKAKAEAIKGRPGFYRTVFALSKARRAIVIDLPLHGKRLDYVLERYLEHRDVKKYGIDVVQGKLTDKLLHKYDQIVYVSRIVVPVSDRDESLVALFGSLQAGARFVTVKKAARNKISDCGLVWYRDGLIPLYYGTDPSMPQYFGSPEWNRNVAGLRWGVICGTSENLKKVRDDSGRPIIGKNLVVLGQYEYLELQNDLGNSSDVRVQDDLFNPNLSIEMYPRIIKAEPIKDKIAIGK